MWVLRSSIHSFWFLFLFYKRSIIIIFIRIIETCLHYKIGHRSQYFCALKNDTYVKHKKFFNYEFLLLNTIVKFWLFSHYHPHQPLFKFPIKIAISVAFTLPFLLKSKRRSDHQALILKRWTSRALMKLFELCFSTSQAVA